MLESERLRSLLGAFDSGEISDVPNWVPFSIVFPTRENSVVVYTTKVQAGPMFVKSPDGQIDVGVIARGGLPQPEHLDAIIKIVGGRKLFFLGDCDPFDLLVFAWLRQHLSVHYLGISDIVLSAVGLRVEDSMTITLPDDELNAMSLVEEFLPNYARLIGPSCAELLARKRKIELEALVAYGKRPHAPLWG